MSLGIVKTSPNCSILVEKIDVTKKNKGQKKPFRNYDNYHFVDSLF